MSQLRSANSSRQWYERQHLDQGGPNNGALKAGMQRVAGDPIAGNTTELAGLSVILATYELGEEFFGETCYGELNQIGPVALIGLLVFGAMRMVRRDSRSLWLGLFWFRIATAVYFGIGSLVPLYANIQTKLYIDAFHPASPDQVFKLNVIVTSGVLIALAAAGASAALLRPASRPRSLRSNDATLLRAGLTFEAIGFATKYFVLLPLAFGSFGEATLPGIVLSLGLLSHVGVYLLTLYMLRGRRSLLPLIAVLVAVELAAGAVQFNKSEATLTTLMVLLAILTDQVSLPRLAFSVGALLLLYSVLVPLTDYGRNALSGRYNSIVAGTLEERLDLVWQFANGKAEAATEDDVQRSWVRISYTNAGTFAISEYDNGRPGPSLDLAAAALIPRVLWPDKPNLTDIAIVFNTLATGNLQSSTSPGLFAEGYWAMGWLGLPVLMLPLGVVLTVISRYGIWIISTGRWWFFPLALLAMRMGLRVDGFYVPDVIGPSATLLVVGLFARTLEQVLGARRGQPALQKPAIARRRTLP